MRKTSADIEKILNRLPEDERKVITSLIEKDPLTGIHNRRKLQQDFRLFMAMIKRYRKECGLLMIDIDYFKDINDDVGHLEGDRILVMVVETIKSILRNYDKMHFYRYGGDEFVVIMPCMTLYNTLAVGERIKATLKKLCNVSVSIGVSHYDPVINVNNELLLNADKALCEAKKSGRGKVLTFRPLKSNPAEKSSAKRSPRCTGAPRQKDTIGEL